MATRWGICGAGRISADFCGAMRVLPTEEHQIQAVAARHIADAEIFAKKFRITRAYGSYEAMAEDPDIDIVYIGTINTQHHRLCLLFLEAGKHVLCEKPMTLTLAGCEEVLQVAQGRELFFMEGVWSRFFPVYDRIRKELATGSLGEIKLVQAKICLTETGNERVVKNELGGGGLKDIGGYAVMAAVLVFKEQPEKIHVDGYVTSDGVDAGGCINLVYPGGRLATLTYHTQVDSPDNSLSILGTKGSILVEPYFWSPTKVRTPSGDYEFHLPENDYKFYYPNTAGFNYEQNGVRDCLKKGLTESPLMSHDDSRMISYIEDEVLRQYGIKYDYP